MTSSEKTALNLVRESKEVMIAINIHFMFYGILHTCKKFYKSSWEKNLVNFWLISQKNIFSFLRLARTLTHFSITS